MSIIIILALVSLGIWAYFLFGIKPIVKMFETSSVCVCGMKGTGKDVLFGNVIARRGKGYVSNVDYTNDDKFDELHVADLDIGKNTYMDFVNDTLSPFVYPYHKGDDIYISDAGVYLPSQYNGELNKKFPYLSAYMALSRQTSHNAIHVNVQNLNRLYDKCREHSDCYITCNWCKFLFGHLVIQKVTIYDRADACIARIKPCKVSAPVFADKATKQSADIYRENFFNSHGDVRSRILIYWNKSKHDTYLFEKKLQVRYPKDEEENS